MSDTKTTKIGFYRNRDHGGERVEVLEYDASDVLYRDAETGKVYAQPVEGFHARFYEEYYSGYYEHARRADFPVQAGQEVVVPRGAVVRSTHPKNKKRVCKRAQKIKVHSVGWGMERDGKAVCNPEITWVGAGGYWCWVDVNEVLEGMKS